nr:LOW QUALITY PROTEIN: RBBP8 N-terminal-like protein [Vicugna pacos]
MESFTESLNRLKDIHENEVMGLQSKLLELNSERCRDAQRVEELCAKNHQLREQQKALKENLRVLENRLRAGLCDRCMVTQELARKKQQEFENSLLQNLQHVFLLTNELTRLQEENDTLKEEVKQLRDRPKPLFREGTSDSPSPLLLPSLGAGKAVTEKPPGSHEETEDDHAERPAGYRASPVAKISPGANLPAPRAPDMSPQRISNQLHGTIAVVRPGSRACSVDRGSTNGTPPLPLTRSSPPSPPCGHSLSLDSFLQAPRPSAQTRESLQRPLQADRLCLLSRRLSLHLRSPRQQPPGSHRSPLRPHAPGPEGWGAEAWEEPCRAWLGLAGALVGMRDPRLEGALRLLLAQQLRARGSPSGARRRGLAPCRGRRHPPHQQALTPRVLRVRWPGQLPRGQHPQTTGPGSPGDKEVTATQDHVPDTPLDLSERGRGRDGALQPASQPGSLSPTTAHTPSPEPPQGAEPPAQPGAQGLSNGTKGPRKPEEEVPPTSEDPPHPLPEQPPGLPSPNGTGNEARGRPKLPSCPQKSDGDSHPELSRAEVQRMERDQLDEPNTSDSEGGLSSEAGATLSTPGNRCFCAKEHARGLQQKRKRALDSDPDPDPWRKGGWGLLTFTQGGAWRLLPGQREPGVPAQDIGMPFHFLLWPQRLQEAVLRKKEPRGARSPRDPEDSSLSPSNSSWEETQGHHSLPRWAPHPLPVARTGHTTSPAVGEYTGSCLTSRRVGKPKVGGLWLVFQSSPSPPIS